MPQRLVTRARHKCVSARANVVRIGRVEGEAVGGETLAWLACAENTICLALVFVLNLCVTPLVSLRIHPEHQASSQVLSSA